MQDVTILLETIALSGVSSILNDIYHFKGVYRFQLSQEIHCTLSSSTS